MADHSYGDHPRRWVFWGFAAIAAYFLLTEHRAHVIEYLPVLLLLACPLMHLFHGHGGHGSGGPDDRKPDEETAGKERKHAGGCH